METFLHIAATTGNVMVFFGFALLVLLGIGTIVYFAVAALCFLLDEVVGGTPLLNVTCAAVMLFLSASLWVAMFTSRGHFYIGFAGQ